MKKYKKMESEKNIINVLKNNKWAAIFFEALLIVIVLLLFSWWQNRGTLAADSQLAPDFVLSSISGESFQLSELKGKKVLVYFFAPWCNICHLSGDNLNDLRAARSEEDLAIVAIGLSWDNQSEIQSFAHDLQLTMPVLYGTSEQINDYQIKGFPTYFVIDEAGRVTHRSVGYSTEIGMRLRT